MSFFFLPSSNAVCESFFLHLESGERRVSEWEREREMVESSKIYIIRLQNLISKAVEKWRLIDWLITWRSGAVLGCARSHADNHGFILDNNDVNAAGDVWSYFALSSRLLNNLPLILLWLCCWLVLLWAPEINASATITTNLGPGRILTGS